MLFLLFCSPFAIRHSPRPVKALLDDGHEGRLDEFVDQFGRGVERAGGLAFRAGGKGEGEGEWRVASGEWCFARSIGCSPFAISACLFAVRRSPFAIRRLKSGEDRLKVEQRFIDRAEFLGVEGGVVDAAADAFLGGGEPGKGTDGLEQVAVVEPGGVNVAERVEELTVEGRQGQLSGERFVVEDVEEGLEAEVKVVEAFRGAQGFVGQGAESGQAVVVANSEWRMALAFSESFGSGRSPFTSRPRSSATIRNSSR